ncbi:2OG-Fe(II) oxygenase [Fodinicola feengrottensis]|uniref:2OG-Fe(II) oxygenase n=1 Tax=Fodinicola feengrottensis TaxID=435914 RepID=UPI0013D4B242
MWNRAHALQSLHHRDRPVQSVRGWSNRARTTRREHRPFLASRHTLGLVFHDAALTSGLCRAPQSVADPSDHALVRNAA